MSVLLLFKVIIMDILNQLKIVPVTALKTGDAIPVIEISRNGQKKEFYVHRRMTNSMYIQIKQGIDGNCGMSYNSLKDAVDYVERIW